MNIVFSILGVLLPVLVILRSKSKGNEQLAEKYDYFYSFLKIVVALDVMKWATYLHAGQDSQLYYFVYYSCGLVLEPFRYYVILNICLSIIDEDSYKGLSFSLRTFFILVLPIIVLHDAVIINASSDKSFIKNFSLLLDRHMIEFNFFLLLLTVLGIHLRETLPISPNLMGIIYGLCLDTFCHSPFLSQILWALGMSNREWISMIRQTSYLASVVIFITYLRSYSVLSLEQQVYVDFGLSRVDQYMQRKLERSWIYTKFATSRTIK